MAASLTKTLQDGRTATVTAHAYGRCTVEINGTYFTDGEVRELPAPRGPATHAIGFGKVLGLTAAEAAVIAADIARAAAEYEASEEGQRAALQLNLTIAVGAQEEARERASDDDDWSGFTAADAAVDAAEEALNAFDAGHPELASKITAERTEREAENFEAGWNR